LYAGLDRSSLGNLQDLDEMDDITASRDYALSVELTVGTPPQAMRCLLDTGNADMWLPTQPCSECDAPTAVLKAGASSTMQQLSPKVNLGDSEGLTAQSIQDKITIGPLNVNSVGIVTVAANALPEPRSWDGICGLAWDSLAKAGDPLYIKIQQQGIRPIFTIIDKVDDARLLVGGEPPADIYVPGSLVWVDAERVKPDGASQVDSAKDFWVVSGGLHIRRQEPIPSRFLLDTSTNFILAPNKFYLGTMRSILPPDVFDLHCGQDANQGNVVVCDCIAASDNLLPVRITFGEREFRLSTSSLFKEVTASHGEKLCLLQIQPNPIKSTGPWDVIRAVLSGDVTADGGHSSGDFLSHREQPLPDDGVPTSVSEASSADDLWILGTAFLEQMVTVLDFESARVGFAQPAIGSSGVIEQMTDNPVTLKVEMVGGAGPMPQSGGTPNVHPDQSTADPFQAASPPAGGSFALPTAPPAMPPTMPPAMPSAMPFQSPLSPQYPPQQNYPPSVKSYPTISQPLMPQQQQQHYSSDYSVGMYSSPASSSSWNKGTYPPIAADTHSGIYAGGQEDLDEEASEDHSSLRVLSAVLLWIAWGVGVAVAVVLLWSWQSNRDVEMLPMSQTERLARANSQLDDEEDDAAE